MLQQNYLLNYQLLKTKRYLIEFNITFILQSITIFFMQFNLPALPLHPPLAIASIIIYLRGSRMLPAIILGSFCAYVLKKLPINIALMFTIADLIGGLLAAKIMDHIIKCDVKIFISKINFIKYIIYNLLTSCLLSSLLKSYAYYTINNNINIHNYLSLYIADLNSLIIINGYILTWSYLNLNSKFFELYFKLDVYKFIYTAISLLTIIFMKQFFACYLIIGCFVLYLYFNFNSNKILTSFVLFINATLLLTHFIAFKTTYLLIFKPQGYIIINVILFILSSSCYFINIKAPKA